MTGVSRDSLHPKAELRATSSDQLQNFRNDGVVCLRNVIDPASIAQLRHAVDSIAAHPQPRAVRGGSNAAGRFIVQGSAGAREADIRRFAEESVTRQIASELLESREVKLFNEVVFVKEPGASATEWHNDYSYMSLSGSKICTVWVALDRVSADTGAMFFVRGSHKEQKLYRPILLGTGRERATGEHRDVVRDIWARTDARDLVSFDLSPGDCTIHHAWTLHGAKANASRTDMRRGIAIRYIGDDVTQQPEQFGVLPTNSTPRT